MTSSVSSTNNSNRVTGIVSGIDTDAQVKKILKNEYAKLDRYKQQVQLLEWQRDIYREANTKLLAVRNAAYDMKLPSVFKTKTVASSDEAIVKATANGDADNTTHTITVNTVMTGVNRISTAELATHQTTLATQFGLSGTISFTLTGKDNIAHTYSFDTSTKSIDNVVSAINDNAEDSGINVGYSSTGNRFVLATADTGSSAVIKAVDTNNFLTSTLKLNLGTASSGTYTLNGTDTSIDYDGATGITFSSNTFTLNNVNYTVTKAGTATVTVSNDTDSAVKKIQAFVDAYNEAISYIDGKVKESRIRDSKHQIKYPPLTDDQKDDMTDDQIKKWETQAKIGILGNDDTLRGMSYTLRTLANGILNNKATDIDTTGVSLTSSSDLPYYASNMLNQFGIAGPVKFSLTGKDGTAQPYSFDPASQSIYDVVRAINANSSTTGVQADFSNSRFTLSTTDEGLNSKIKVNDTTGFFANQLKMKLTSPASIFSTAKMATSASTLAAQFGVYGTVSFTLTGKDSVANTYSFATGSKSMSDVVSAINANTSTSGIYASYGSDGFNLYTTGTGTSATMQIADTSSFLKNQLKLNLTTGVNLFSSASLTANTSDTLNTAFGISGSVGFTLTGKSGSYGFNFASTDTLQQVIDGINTQTSATGIQAVYSGNGFNLRTTDTDATGFITIADTDSFLKNNLKLNIVSGTTYYGTTTSSSTNTFAGVTNSSNLTNSYTGTQTSSLTNQTANVDYLKYRSLSAVGIATEQYQEGSGDNAKLYISTSVLKKAISDDPDAVWSLFNASQTITNADKTTTTYNIGIATAMYDLAKTNISALTTKAGVAGAAYDNSDIAQAIYDEDELIDKLNDRISDKEDYWYARFTAMEKALEKANTQSSWLTQQFSSSK